VINKVTIVDVKDHICQDMK